MKITFDKFRAEEIAIGDCLFIYQVLYFVEDISKSKNGNYYFFDAKNNDWEGVRRFEWHKNRPVVALSAAKLTQLRRNKEYEVPENFIIKDGGERELNESGMVREPQDGRPDFTLCFPEAVPYAEQMLTRFAMHMTNGAKKYSRRNWEKANSQEELQRYKASSVRHFMQWLLGETDEDHLSAVLFNMQCAEFVKGRLDGKW